MTLIGCAKVIPVNRESGILNFETPNIKQEAKTKYSIAIVTSELKGFEEKASPQSVSPITGLPIGGTAFTPGNYLTSSGKVNDLGGALNRTFMEIITKKGFTTKGPYNTFDDMTYLDKNDTYLAIVPQFTFNIRKVNVETKNEQLYYSEKGTFSIDGEFYLKIVEPVTNQALINRRINLSDFKLSKPYIYEKQKPAAGNQGLTRQLIDSVGAPESLTDNTDKVLADLLNEFYAKSTEKIIQYLSREELLAIEKDVQKLKGMKVY
jgi:neuraminyllactose-binding hemagglutinin